jgi:uncharacterized membrane protein YjjP (DUF1212 family)
MNQQQKFIIELAETLQNNGLPAHRIDNSIQIISEALETPVEISSTPEILILSFSSPAYTTMKKSKGSSLNFDRMDQLHQLINQISNKEINLDEANLQLEEIKKRKIRYSKWVNILFIAISNASAACLFGGGYAEILVSSVIGFAIGFILELLSSFPNLSRLNILFSSTIALFIAKIGVLFLGNYSVEIVSITGLILLIPGFSFSQSVTELAHGHAQSAIVRFSNVFLIFLMLAVGLGIGSQLVSLINIHPLKFHFQTLPSWVTYLAILIVPAGFGILFNAKKEHYFWMLIACVTSYFSMKYLSIYAIPEFAVLISAFILGIVSNVLSYALKKSSSLMLVPGIILLVPGSIGFKTVTFLMNQQTMNGLESAISTLIIAVALTCGLLFSNMLFKHREVF